MIFERLPGVAARGADGSRQRARLRDRVRRGARIDCTPHHHGAVARIDAPGQDPRHAGDQGADPVHQISGQMRSRRVPARRVQGDLELIGGRGDRPGPDRDLADRQPRIAVQREDARHPRQRARRDGVDRTAGHQLLGRLEDQPHADGQFRHRRQGQGGAQQHRGVRVVTAGMRDVGDHRRVRRPGPLGHRQRVHIGAQRDPGPVLRTEITRQAGASGQHLGVEARIGQMRGDELRGGELLTAQLGVGMQMAAPLPPFRRSGRPATVQWRRADS